MSRYGHRQAHQPLPSRWTYYANSCLWDRVRFIARSALSIFSFLSFGKQGQNDIYQRCESQINAARK